MRRLFLLLLALAVALSAHAFHHPWSPRLSSSLPPLLRRSPCPAAAPAAAAAWSLMPTPPRAVAVAVAAAEKDGGSGSGGCSGGGGSGVRIQTLDYTTLVRVAAELRRRLLPGRVENVVQVDDFSIMLQVRSVESLSWLLICWQPESARVCIQQQQQQNRGASSGGGGGGGKKGRRGGGGGMGSASSFYSLPGQLKVFLQLKTLIGIATPLPGERILVLEFAERVTDTAATHKLYVEVMGRRSNVILVGCKGNEEEVLACGYQVSPTKSIRPVSVGQPYTLPPPLTMPMPPPLPEAAAELEAYEAEFTRKVSLVPSYPLAKALMSAYRGLSPQLVESMAGSLGMGMDSLASVPVESLPDGTLGRLFRGPFATWLRVLAAEQQAQQKQTQTPSPPSDSISASNPLLLPGGGLSPDGARYTPILFPPSPSPIDVDDADTTALPAWRPVASVLDLVDRYYTACLERQELLDLQRRGLARVASVLTRLRRTQGEFERQLASASEESIAKLQEKADLLTTYAYSWKEGDEDCLCYTFDTGAEVRIPLRPGKSAADEAQSAYQRIRKLRRSVEAVAPLLRKVDVKIAYVEEIESSITQLGATTSSLTQDLAVMREIAEELGLEGPGGAPASPRATFFSTILNRLSVPDADADPSGSGGGGGGGAGGGAKGGKGQKKQQGKGKGGKNANSGKKASAAASPAASPSMAIQTYAYISSSVDDEEETGVAGTAAIRAIVGRNSRQNDHVTFSLAKPHELWFHAQGVPGSHVLLRFDPGAEVPDDAMQFAADLAAHFSKARGSKEVPVMYTSPKNLKRIVGGGPGMVQVTKEKIVWGRPSQGEGIVRRQQEEEQEKGGEGRGLG